MTISVLFPNNNVLHFTDAKSARKALRDADLSVTNFYKLELADNTGAVWAPTEDLAKACLAALGNVPADQKVPVVKAPKGPSKKAARAQAKAEQGFVIHDEDYRGHSIVITRHGNFCHATYAGADGKSFSAGDHPTRESAIGFAHTTIDLYLDK